MMKQWLLPGMVGVCLLILGPAPAQQTGKLAAKNGWLANLDSAKKLARKTGKPLMVVFRCEP